MALHKPCFAHPCEEALAKRADKAIPNFDLAIASRSALAMTWADLAFVTVSILV